MRSEQQQFTDDVNYGRELLMRINDISIAIKQGGDGMVETMNLWTALTDEISEPIRERVASTHTAAIIECGQIRAEIRQAYPKISPAHREQIYQGITRPIKAAMSSQIKKIIITRLHEVGIVLHKEKQLPISVKPRMH